MSQSPSTEAEDGVLSFAEENAVDLPKEREDLTALVNAYADARLEHERVKALEKLAAKPREEAERALFDALRAGGFRSVRTERGLFTLNDQAWPRIVDPVAARNWAEIEHPELITLNHTSLGPVVREALKEGLDLPPGVDATFTAKVNWRKAP